MPSVRASGPGGLEAVRPSDALMRCSDAQSPGLAPRVQSRAGQIPGASVLTSSLPFPLCQQGAYIPWASLAPWRAGRAPAGRRVRAELRVPCEGLPGTSAHLDDTQSGTSRRTEGFEQNVCDHVFPGDIAQPAHGCHSDKEHGGSRK